MRSLSLLFSSLLFFAGNGFAQSLKDSASIIQVRKEPRHHLVLDNEWVRILDVHLPPGDTSLYHKHTTPSIFLVLSNTKTGAQALIEPRKRSFNHESIWFEDFTDTPRIHRVWNEDKIDFHTIDIELPHEPSGKFNANATVPNSKLLFDEKRARAYRLTMPAGTSFSFDGLPTPIVVVGLSGPNATGTVNGKAFREKGDYIFVPAGTGFSVSNGTANAEFAVFLIK